jgi:hypothetical protein
MNIEDRITAFEKLGNYLSAIDTNEFRSLAERARNENPWFTLESIKSAIEGVKLYLDSKNLTRWVSNYRLTPVKPQTVAVVMAGNIPLVGFHDFLSVLISGHSLQVKLSSKDSVLLSHLAHRLIEIEPRFKSVIQFVEQLKSFDAVIATGSDNSARYFHYYFGKYPNIIRKNRTSCAVLTGQETDNDLYSLGKDVFSYFGLGCRNVSKIYIPRAFDLTLLLNQWMPFQNVLDHHKYHNNYDYQKSILLINGAPFLDSGFVLLQESEKIVSPISVVYYELYEDEGALALKLIEAKNKIQCIVGHSTPASIPFGEAQSPMAWDYADQIDTLKFLENLN